MNGDSDMNLFLLYFFLVLKYLLLLCGFDVYGIAVSCIVFFSRSYYVGFVVLRYILKIHTVRWWDPTAPFLLLLWLTWFCFVFFTPFSLVHSVGFCPRTSWVVQYLQQLQNLPTYKLWMYRLTILLEPFLSNWLTLPIFLPSIYLITTFRVNCRLVVFSTPLRLPLFLAIHLFVALQ